MLSCLPKQEPPPVSSHPDAINPAGPTAARTHDTQLHAPQHAAAFAQHKGLGVATAAVRRIGGGQHVFVLAHHAVVQKDLQEARQGGGQQHMGDTHPREESSTWAKPCSAQRTRSPSCGRSSPSPGSRVPFITAPAFKSSSSLPAMK